MSINKNRIINCTLIIISIILCWIGTGDYVYPVIKMNSIAICIIILFILLVEVIVFSKGKVKFDLLSIILLIRLLYYIIIVAFSGYDNYLLQIFAPIFCFIAYFCVINLNISTSNMIFFSKIVLIFLALQITIDVINALILGIPMYLVKNNIITPLGNSNFLTTFFLLFIPLIYSSEKSELKKILYLVTVGILILLTRSNSGFIIYLLFIGITLLLKKENSTKKITMLIVAFFCIFLVINNYGGYFDRLSNSIGHIFSNDSTEISIVLNGRDELFEINNNLIWEKPLFGFGYSYREYTPSQMVSHNWIYESLLTGGLISFILQIFSFIIIIIYSRRSSKLKLKQNLYIIIILALIQGLVEPSIGMVYFDLIFWLIIGAYINELRYIE